MSREGISDTVKQVNRSLWGQGDSSERRISYFPVCWVWRVPVGLNPTSWPWRNNSFWLRRLLLIGGTQAPSTNLLKLPENGGLFYAAPDQARSWDFSVYSCPWSDFNHLAHWLKSSWGTKTENKESCPLNSKMALHRYKVNNKVRLSRNETSVGLFYTC